MQIKQEKNIIYFDQFWQKPAKTELYAFEKMRTYKNLDFIYVAFPWATFIDFLQTNKPLPKDLNNAYQKLIELCQRSSLKKVTVCQHIYLKRYFNIFKACGITEVFWPHAAFDLGEVQGLKISPFPLYSVMIPEQGDRILPYEERDYWCSFIGAYDPKYYQTDIRRKIFDLPNLNEKYLIKERKEWHYQSAVYKEQLTNQNFGDQKQDDSKARELEYRDLLNRSIFSLCPSGSGPNSIRIWESLAYEAIPVIFADNLRMPGDQNLWSEAAIFVGETGPELNQFIQLLPDLVANRDLIAQKVKACRELFIRYGRDQFVSDILLCNKASKDSTNTSVVQNIKKTKLVVVDPGLKDKGSHHHQLNLSLSKSMSVDDLMVLAHAKADLKAFSYNIKPSFEYSIYDYKNTNPREFHQQSVSFASRLIEELDQVEGDISLCLHTCTAPLLYGLSLALDQLEKVKIKKILLELMFLPKGFSKAQDSGEVGEFDFNKYITAIDKIKNFSERNKLEFKIATSNSVFQKEYNDAIKLAKISNVNVQIHPHVMYRGEVVSEKRENRETIKLLCHAGDPRPGKGLGWLTQNIPLLLENLPDNIQIYFHANALRFPDAFPEIAKGLSMLEEIAKSNTRFVMLRNSVDDADWQKFLLGFDAFLLPLEPEYYGEKTSGLVLDALLTLQSIRHLFIFKDTLSFKILAESNLEPNTIDGDVFDLCARIKSLGMGSEEDRRRISNSIVFKSLFGQSHHDYVLNFLNR